MDDYTPGKLAEEIAYAASLDGNSVSDLRRLLLAVLNRQVALHILETRDVHLLTLCLGLSDGRCRTLKEIGQEMHNSPECIRQKQHFLLSKKIKEPLFFQLLEEYSHHVKLPRGIRYHLHKRRSK
jgi:DNA-directed RNA polymerase sigma subunit (sigma70/sigma32)